MNVMYRQSERILTQILSTNGACEKLNDTIKRRILNLLYIQERAHRNSYRNEGSYLYTESRKNYNRSIMVISNSNCHIIAHYIGYGLSDDMGNKKGRDGFNYICNGFTKLMSLEQAEREIGFPCVLQIRERIPKGKKESDTINEREDGVSEHSAIILGRDEDENIIIFEQRGLGGNIGIRKFKQLRYGNVYSFGKLEPFWGFDEIKK